MYNIPLVFMIEYKINIKFSSINFKFCSNKFSDMILDFNIMRFKTYLYRAQNQYYQIKFANCNLVSI